ncbi:MAG: peroxide stress protein YaaA [Acaryochloridaceae cyanobacterium RL_2_7]|nr:peroxide stress protein YaaA [Acaryochloridaceae cyanobacterium RL_2_7]
MLMVISPAKTLDFSPRDCSDYTIPDQLDQSQELVEQLRELSPSEIGTLMKISPKLSDLNYQRFQDFHLPFSMDNAKPALLAFKGDVYKGIDTATYKPDDLNFAQKHLRILSGLYGILRPLDLIQPYRLEMGTKFQNAKGKNLYEFWGSQISELINQSLEGQSENVLVNLASNEYFKAIDQKRLKARLLNIAFKEHKNGAYKVVAIHAKRARGLMVDYGVRNRIQTVEALKGFDLEGYVFREDLSTESDWVFARG